MDSPTTNPAVADPTDSKVLSPEAATPPRQSIWHRPVSYRAQCWVAWAGLTAFGARGLAAMSAGDPLDVERMIAVVLSLVWGIDLLRGRSTEV